MPVSMAGRGLAASPQRCNHLPPAGRNAAGSVRVELRVLLGKILLLIRQFIERKNRIGSARGHACPTVDAAGGVDIHLRRRLKSRLVFLRVNAVGGTCVDAKQIFDTSIGDYISHDW